MKTLVITNHSYMLYQFRTELLLRLKSFGEVIISMPFKGHHEDFINMGFRCIDTKIDRRGINPVVDFSLFRFYNKLLKSERPDIVITYSIKPNVYAGFLCRKRNIPYFVNVQGLGTAFQSQPIASIATLLYKMGLKKAKAVFFENQFNADEFVKRHIISKDKEVVLHGAGVNLDTYQYLPYGDELDGVHILYLGRIMREKGIGETFAAMERIKKIYGSKVVFDVVGFFEDEYKDKVNQLVENGIITFHGFQTDPKPYYAMSHCLVLASYHEGMSNVLLEASATGRAIITTNIPGCKEAVDEGVNGFLCKKQDSVSLTACLDRFLKLTPQERKEMGIKGRIKMENEFDKKIIVDETVRVILENS